MTQAWSDDVFALSNEGETDLQNIEYNFQCLRTLFSGLTFGLTGDPGHPWYDTNKDLLKIRNAAGDDWLGVLALAKEGTTGLVWFHGDDLSNQEGWAIDESITDDRVVLLKNHGSGTYTTGRAAAGSWEVTGITIDPHTHPAGTLLGPSHRHGLTSRDTSQGAWPDDLVSDDGYTDYDGTQSVTGDTGSTPTPDTTSSDLSWRIKGQVGIVIYPDI